ncbi:SurA N-terminal domain-containing protein [Rhabdochlamydiaceae symbiont of Dictyostelium giganteum]|uniref:SurA N-terminal domain-containing protein n=1 Tax=Rhabdochlamydiaceae symbiont of Dictyostelium giganteum TaxID=3342349 RepID=UPI00384E1F1C
MSRLMPSLLMCLALLAPLRFLSGAGTPTQEITVDNRILATVQGKTFTVLDVVKQMNLFLSQNYPQYLSIPEAKLQFYQSQWKPTLRQMIDHHLMVLDAKGRQIQVSDAEVREELHTRYGPQVMQTLESLGLSYDEMKEKLKQDIVVQKIQWVRISSKVLSKVTAEMTKEAYADYLKHSPPQETWVYQFLTLRHESLDTALSLAQQIKTLQDPSNGSLSSAMEMFKQKLPEVEWKLLSLSKELTMKDQELSSLHREALQTLSPDVWSSPTVQKTREGTDVVRIFHLKEHVKKEAPSFESLSSQIRDYLLNQQAESETRLYLTRLYERFNFDLSQLDIPSQFEPFSS